MKKVQGQPLPLGVTLIEEKVNFSIAVPEGKSCSLLMYRAGENEPCESFEMEESIGEVRVLALDEVSASTYEYNYLMNGEVVTDPYVKALAGRHEWGVEKKTEDHEVRGIICDGHYDWEGDRPLCLPYEDVIAYALHVRGFTKDSGSKVKHKGTFEGVVEKIPYLKELGINQIQCMPVYEFEENGRYPNYWGYGKGYYFAPKSAYSADGNAVRSLKNMVKECHKAGIEVVLEMPFDGNTPKQMMEECLRYYLMEYHIDGFILNPCVAPMDAVSMDPLLKKTKIMTNRTDFRQQ